MLVWVLGIARGLLPAGSQALLRRWGGGLPAGAQLGHVQVAAGGGAYQTVCGMLNAFEIPAPETSQAR